MIDGWFATGSLVFPVPLDDDLAIALGAPAVVATIATAILLACTTTALVWTKRESLAGYLLLSGVLPLACLLLPWTSGGVAILACAAMVSCTFWWFVYRQRAARGKSDRMPARIAWSALLVAFLTAGGLVWFELRDVQAMAAEREGALSEPSPLGGAVLEQEALLYDFKGRLFAYDLQTGARRLLMSQGVVDVDVAPDGSAWIVSATAISEDQRYDAVTPAGLFTLTRYRARAMHPFPSEGSGPNERPAFLAMWNDSPVLIGPKAAFTYNPSVGQWRKTVFQQVVHDNLVNGASSAVVSLEGTAFIGINQGEFGGGLAVVDLASGSVTRPERRGPELCDGPLNSSCDPITGIVPVPEDARCMLASIGLSHLLMHGRIIRICPEGIHVELVRPLERPSEAAERHGRAMATGKLESATNTEAFFDLLSVRNGSIWAITPFAAYKRESGRWSRHALPELEERGALSISQGLPGIVVLSTWGNARNSLSGATPQAFATR